MSLEDRDWYREEMRQRNSASSSLRRSGYIHPNLRHLHSAGRSPSRTKIALVWLLVLGGLYLVFSWAAQRSLHLDLATSHALDLVDRNRTRLLGLFCVLFVFALIRSIRGSRRRRQLTAWQKAVYNPKEFRRER